MMRSVLRGVRSVLAGLAFVGPAALYLLLFGGS
jgi:hypothetical protein